MQSVVDNKLDIVLQMHYHDIIELCQTDKSFYNLCSNPQTWKLLIQRDFPNITTIYTQKQYIELLKLFNAHTNFTMKLFINNHIMYKNYNDLYDITFHLLVDYINAKLMDDTITIDTLINQLSSEYKNNHVSDLFFQLNMVLHNMITKLNNDVD